MDTARIHRAEEIFELAIGLPSERRGSAVAERCAGDAELRAFVDRLLENYEAGTGDFMGRPVFTPTPDRAAVLAPGHPARIGHYEIIRVLGEGGMGVVYEARQENPHRTVALKVIRSGLPSRSVLRRFQHEAEVLGHLQHPGIACIYEAATADMSTRPGVRARQPYFAMEFVRGEPLNAYADHQRLGVRERLELLARICDAVQHAHQKGVIHRDLKPGNILVDETGQPKILDFGVARVTDADIWTMTTQTGAGQLVGTVPYMSPEQITGDARLLDTRSDVYALGVILFELLSARLPYDVDSRSLAEAARRIRDEEPARLASVNRTFRGEIETIVAKALEKDKTRRYQSASDLAADIRRYLRGEAIEAKRDSGWYVLRKTLARYRAAVAVALAFALLITAAAIALGVMYHNQTRARTVAEQARAAEERQRHLAESNEARASDEAAKATAVMELLQNMLSSADPRAVKGPDYTVRQLLDDFVAELGDQLKGQPEIELAVRLTVGKTYYALGLYQDAERHLRACVDIGAPGLSAEHSDMLRARSALAELLWAIGETAEAEELLRGLLEACRRVEGPRSEWVATTLSDLGLVLQDRGEYDEAESLLRESLTLRRALFGNEHADVATGLNNLAVLLRLREDYVKAEPLYREALAIRRRLLGDEHPHVASSLQNLALLLHYQGRYDEAEPLYAEALAIYRKTLAGDHPILAGTLNSLAGLRHMRGDFDGAEALYREALTIRRKALPAGHPDIARTLSNLAGVLQANGSYADAENLYREALAIVREALPAGHPVIATRLGRLATNLLKQGQHAEAVKLLRECLKIRRKNLPADHWEIADAESTLGSSLTLAGKYEEAELLLLRSHDSLKSIRDNQTPVQRGALRRTLERIVQLYDSWGLTEQAERWRTELRQTRSGETPSGEDPVEGD